MLTHVYFRTAAENYNAWQAFGLKKKLSCTRKNARSDYACGQGTDT